jgi:hypothetical protein
VAYRSLAGRFVEQHQWDAPGFTDPLPIWRWVRPAATAFGQALAFQGEFRKAVIARVHMIANNSFYCGWIPVWSLNLLNETEREMPNAEWYVRRSQSCASPVHCPFATVEACPRYYQSRSLIGEAGSTKIPKKEDQRLLKYWKRSDLWPRTTEQATAIAGESGNPAIFSKFCPEVIGERFGYFATSLTRYANELDVHLAHERLSKEGVPEGRPDWSWSSCMPLHFTECSVYSVLSYRAAAVRQADAQPWWREHLAKIVVAVLTAIATALITKLFA